MSTRKRRPTEVADPSLIPVLDLPENSASFAAMMEVHTNKSLAFLLSLDPAVLESVTEILIAIQDAREPDSDEEVDDEDACAAKEDVGTAAGGYGGGYGTDEDAEDDDPLRRRRGRRRRRQRPMRCVGTVRRIGPPTIEEQPPPASRRGRACFSSVRRPAWSRQTGHRNSNRQMPCHSCVCSSRRLRVNCRRSPRTSLRPWPAPKLKISTFDPPTFLLERA